MLVMSLVSWCGEKNKFSFSPSGADLTQEQQGGGLLRPPGLPRTDPGSNHSQLSRFRIPVRWSNEGGASAESLLWAKITRYTFVIVSKLNNQQSPE